MSGYTYFMTGARGMTEYGHVLCLFCKTGKEQGVVQAINESGLGRAIYPQRIRRRYSKAHRGYEQERAPLLPGYVFVYLTDGTRAVEWRQLSGVIRALGYGEGGQDYLAGSDLAFADWLWQRDGAIEGVKVMEAGRRIEIVDSVFRFLRGTITRVDRRKQTCCIELDAGGIIRQVWLPYEMVEPVDR